MTIPIKGPGASDPTEGPRRPPESGIQQWDEVQARMDPHMTASALDSNPNPTSPASAEEAANALLLSTRQEISTQISALEPAPTDEVMAKMVEGLESAKKLIDVITSALGSGTMSADEATEFAGRFTDVTLTPREEIEALEEKIRNIKRDLLDSFNKGKE